MNKAIKRVRAFLSPLRKRLTKSSNHFLKNVSGIIHVGANYGQEKNTYQQHNLDVIWVEAIPDIFSDLEKQLTDYPKQVAYKALITDIDNKQYDFHIASNKGASSSIFDLKEHKDIWPDIDYTSTIPLLSTTLTSLVKENDIQISNYPALIMDTQGSELLVLKGAVPLIRNFKYIKTEVSDFEAYEGCCQVDDINAFMRENGFKQVSKHKIAKREQGGSYFDIVYKRKG